jgi:hypothetical protein
MNITEKELNSIVRDVKFKTALRAIGQALLAIGFSATIMLFGLFVLPPWLGWIPFFFGFFNAIMAIVANWQGYHAAVKAVDRATRIMNGVIKVINTPVEIEGDVVKESEDGQETKV